MQISEKGVEFIKLFEGCKLIAYKDGGGVATIGIGTTVYPNGSKVRIGDKCTLPQAIAYFKNDAKVKENWVNKLVKVKLTQNQFDALMSFTYNLGEGALQKSTLLKKLNAGDYKGASEEFLKWNKDNGVVIAGLDRRRKAEKSLFLI